MDFETRNILLILGCLSSLQTSLAFLFGLLNGQPNAVQPTCDLVPEYIVLSQAVSSQPCLSNTQIWSLIEPVAQRQHACLGKAITEITAYLEAAMNHGEHCQCNGEFNKNYMNPVGGGHDHYGECLYGNPNCQYLWDYYYLRYGHYNEKSQCQTHHHVWKHLRDIKNVGGDLQSDMVLHLSLTYGYGLKDTCFCKFNQPSTQQPTSSSSVSSLNTQTTPQTSVVIETSTRSLVLPKCQKYELISDIAKSNSESHPDARQCPSGNRTSDEAFIIVNCEVGSPHSWRKGENVMSKCDDIPHYTPIAAVKSNSSDIGLEWELSGIFMGCTKDGFKMSYQDCDTRPTIVHIENGNGTGKNDPYNYFVIMNPF